MEIVSGSQEGCENTSRGGWVGVENSSSPSLTLRGGSSAVKIKMIAAIIITRSEWDDGSRSLR